MTTFKTRHNLQEVVGDEIVLRESFLGQDFCKHLRTLLAQLSELQFCGTVCHDAS